MKKIAAMIFFIAILSINSIFFASYGEEEKETEKELGLYAQSAVLIDADSGRVLYGKEENVVRPMASTTKIMTCILALEMGNLNDIVTVTSNAAAQPKVHLGMRKDENYYLKDLLYSLMLESHNDTAVAIAEHIGGSVEGFALLMNQKARDLGCSDTYFITPNGLDAQITEANGEVRTHATTATDLARIMKYCIMESEKKDMFLEITRTRNYFFTDKSGKRSFNCINHNALLSTRNDAISGKTGFTGGAGYSYVGAIENDGRTFIISLLGCGWPPHKTWKWSDSSVLLNYGIKNYYYQDVEPSYSFSPVPVENGIPDDNMLEGDAYTELKLNRQDEKKTLRVLMREDEHVDVKYDIPKRLKAPVAKGDAVGKITYLLNGGVIQTFPVYTAKAVDAKDLLWCIRQVAGMYFAQE